MRKRMLKILVLVIGGLVGVLIVAAIGGTIWVRNYLAEPIDAGPGILRVEKPSLNWDFSAHARSATFVLDSTRFRANDIRIDPHLVPSLLSWRPSVALSIDSLIVMLSEEEDTSEDATGEFALPDSLGFPEFALPVDFGLNVSHAIVSQGDSTLVALQGVRANSDDPRRASLRIDHVKRVPVRLGISPSVQLDAAWESEDNVGAVVRVAVGDLPDSVVVTINRKKEDLLRGGLQVEAYVQSSAPYRALLPLPDTMGTLGEVHLVADIQNSDTSAIDLAIEGDYLDAADIGPFVLGSYAVGLAFQARGDRATWRVTGDGSTGARIRLGGNVWGFEADSLLALQLSPERLRTNLSGYVAGVPVQLGDTTFRAGVRISSAWATLSDIEATLRSADSSRIQGRLVYGKGPLRATLQAWPVPTERWMTVFTDTMVHFDDARIWGDLRGPALALVLNAYDVKAYGARADSVVAWQRLTIDSFVLDSSRIFEGEIAWRGAGVVPFVSEQEIVDFRVMHPQFGSAGYRLMKDETHVIESSRLAVSKVPHELVETIPSDITSLTTEVRMHLTDQEGAIRAEVEGRFENDPYAVNAQASWGEDTLRVDTLLVTTRESTIRAALTSRLTALTKLQQDPTSLEGISFFLLDIDSVQVVDFLGPFLVSPPVSAGNAQGRLTYRPHEGLQGEVIVRDIAMAQGSPLTVTYLTVFGLADSLAVLARIGSELPEDASVSLNLERIREIASGPIIPDSGLIKDQRGTMMVHAIVPVNPGDTLRSAIGVWGGYDLPGNAGIVRNVRFVGNAVLPLTTNEFSPYFYTSEFKARYLIPRIDTQLVSGSVVYENNVLRVDSLLFTSNGTRTALGTARIVLDSVPRIDATLTGTSLSLAPIDLATVSLTNFQLRAEGSLVDPNLEFNADSVDVRYLRPPLGANTVLVGVDAEVAAIGEPAVGGGVGQRPLQINLTAGISGTEVSYRLGSLEALQNLFGQGTGGPTYAAPGREVQVDIAVRTVGDSNRIVADLLQMPFQASVQMTGTYPYLLFDGRVFSNKGTIGVGAQEFGVRNFLARWTNDRLESGEISLTAAKELAADCQDDEGGDSCTVFTYLEGTLANAQFSYESDCGEAQGDGADITSLVLSVRRGCYSRTPVATQGGETVGGQALALLEPTLNRQLTELAGRFTENWIATVNVSGLGALVADSADQPFSIEVISKQFMRFRLNASALYQALAEGAGSAWEYMLSLQWWPPFGRWLSDDEWERRLEGNLTVEAAIIAQPEESESERFEDAIEQRVGVRYEYEFWNPFGD